MSDDIETIATFQSLPGAEACKLRLESEGLTVFLTDAETIRTDWLLSNAVGSIKVQVPREQVEVAKNLLEQIERRHTEQSKHAGQEFCLACGAEMPKETTSCPACGWTYASKGGEEVAEEDAAENEGAV